MKKKQLISSIITIMAVIFLAFMLDTGYFWHSLWTMIGLSILIAAYRIYKGWTAFITVIEMGAEQLRLLTNKNKGGKK